MLKDDFMFMLDIVGKCAITMIGTLLIIGMIVGLCWFLTFIFQLG